MVKKYKPSDPTSVRPLSELSKSELRALAKLAITRQVIVPNVANHRHYIALWMYGYARLHKESKATRARNSPIGFSIAPSSKEILRAIGR